MSKRKLTPPTVYKVLGRTIFASSDKFHHQLGCSITDTQIKYIDNPFYSVYALDSIDPLLRHIAAYHGVEFDSIILNSCGEAGRIDVQHLSIGGRWKRCIHSKKVEQRFENGDVEGYIDTYTYYIRISHDNGETFSNEPLRHPSFSTDGYFIVGNEGE